MNLRPIAGIDVGKYFSEMAVLSPSNDVVAHMRINHDSYTDVERAVELLKKVEKDFASRPFVVMESTGHYHKILFRSLCKNGFEVSIINPIQTEIVPASVEIARRPFARFWLCQVFCVNSKT